MVQLNVLDTPMQIGHEILQTEMQRQVICFFWEVLLLVRRATNRPALPSPLQKQSMIALSAAAQEVVWLQQLTSDLLNRSIHETISFEDN